MLGVSDLGRTDRRMALRILRNVHGGNLTATIDGAPGPFVVVAAHLDSVLGAPGADDNASGVAVLLELARQLSDRAARNVMLAVVDLEEAGRIGSRQLVRELTRDRAVTAMIGLDAVGYYSSEPNSQALPPGLRLLLRKQFRVIRANRSRGDFLTVICRRSSRRLAAGIARASANRGLACVVVPDPRPDGPAGVLATAFARPLATLDRSDHASFWRRGIPAVLLTDTANLRNATYHTPADLPATLDYAALAKVAGVLVDTVNAIAG